MLSRRPLLCVIRKKELIYSFVGRYELTDFTRGRQTGESLRDLDLPDQQIIIANGFGGDGGGDGSGGGGDTHLFNVSFSRRFYFGRGHSVPSGGEVTVRFRDRPPVELLWGVEKEEPVRRQVRTAIGGGTLQPADLTSFATTSAGLILIDCDL